MRHGVIVRIGLCRLSSQLALQALDFSRVEQVEGRLLVGFFLRFPSIFRFIVSLACGDIVCLSVLLQLFDDLQVGSDVSRSSAGLAEGVAGLAKSCQTRTLVTATCMLPSAFMPSASAG